MTISKYVNKKIDQQVDKEHIYYNIKNKFNTIFNNLKTTKQHNYTKNK